MCDALERMARLVNPRATVWKGPGDQPVSKASKSLGTPLGHDNFVAAHLESVLAEHQILLTRIPLVKDVQSAWLLLLHCASARACFQIKVVRPSAACSVRRIAQRDIVAMFVEHSAERSQPVRRSCPRCGHPPFVNGWIGPLGEEPGVLGELV